jgi:hypothetical protein
VNTDGPFVTARRASHPYNRPMFPIACTLTGRRITHHRQGGLTPTALADVVRAYEVVTDDQLVLTVTDGSQNRLLWERVRRSCALGPERVSDGREVYVGCRDGVTRGRSAHQSVLPTFDQGNADRERSGR